MSNAGPSSARRALDEFGEHVDADAHVRREHDRDALRAYAAISALPASSKPVVPTTAAMPASRARGEMRERSRRAREIDQHVGDAHRGVDIRRDAHAGRAPEALAGIGADRGAARRRRAPPRARGRARRASPRSAPGPCGRRRRQWRCARVVRAVAQPECRSFPEDVEHAVPEALVARRVGRQRLGARASG